MMFGLPFVAGIVLGAMVLAIGLAVLLLREKTLNDVHRDAFCKSPISSSNLARCSSGSPL